MLKRSRTHSSTGRGRQISTKPVLADNQGNRPKLANAQQVHDKYISLARESITLGDRVMAESYYQHAEHYLRLINEQRDFVSKTQPQDVNVEAMEYEETNTEASALQ